MKRKKLSTYECRQVDIFLYELYSIWGKNLDAEECRNEGWIVYLTGRKKYAYEIGDAEYWEYVEKNVRERLKQLRKNRNEKCHFESKMSLNCKYGEEKEEIGTIIPCKNGNFENGVILWNYIQNLGKKKYKIIKLMYEGEDDYDIMTQLHLSEEEYFETKMEIRNDFQFYINC